MRQLASLPFRWSQGEVRRTVLVPCLPLVREVASENLASFASSGLGIFPPGNFAGQNINPQLIWLRLDIVLNKNFQKGVGAHKIYEGSM